MSFIVFIGVVFAFLPDEIFDGDTNQITQEELIGLAKKGRIDTITIKDNRLLVETYGSSTKGLVKTDSKLSEPQVYKLLEDAGVSDWELEDIWIEEYRARRPDPFLTFIGLSIPIALIIQTSLKLRSLGKDSKPNEVIGDTGERPFSESFAGLDFVSYHIDPNQPKIVDRKNLAFLIILVLGVFLVFGVVFVRNQIAAQSASAFGTGPYGMIGVALVVPVVAGLFFVSARKGVANVWKQLASLEIAIGDQWVARKQDSLPILVLRKEEIQSIDEEPGKGIIIRTSNPGRFIFVPTNLASYKEVKEQLNRLMPVTSGKELSREGRKGWLISLGWIGALAVIMILDNPILALIATGVLVFSICWVMVITIRMRQQLQRNAVWVMILLPLILAPMILGRLSYLFMLSSR